MQKKKNISKLRELGKAEKEIIKLYFRIRLFLLASQKLAIEGDTHHPATAKHRTKRSHCGTERSLFDAKMRVTRRSRKNEKENIITF